jgi:WD40 repeat protein
MPALAQQAAAPPRLLQEPILRIDPGMHTAPIWRIGVDAACTLLATGSHDKTVRLWRLPEGKLLRTLRPPVGPGGDAGKVFAVAVAPDGSWVAAAGW